MPVKFNQYWRLNREAIKGYERFLLKDFVPGMNKLGIHVVAGWSVLVGGYSEFLVEGVSNDLHELEVALKSRKYKELSTRLLTHITSYKTKVLVQNGAKDAYTTDYKESTVKFTQMWDIISSKQSGYKSFVAETFRPLLETLGINIAGEWEVLIGDGPRIIYEGRTHDVASLIGNLQSDKFRSAKKELKHFVENYESRLLTFHLQKTKGYKSASYRLISF